MIFDQILICERAFKYQILYDSFLFKESQTNANLVDEYHSLYELQRKRLEASVSDLTTEKDLWSNAAYSLALKVSELYITFWCPL